ncbi:CRTAC1 family protein [Occallatibacter savannae]|uniref:CRTAC1 family protein n=1 Tax=Occallatibacter savannae TaxID=1002691 RepID=UPI000D69C86D|nr:CRTAC1 family protein [Occallatibacter savannae]
MIIPRRRFLGSTGFLLGNALLDRLTTPLWRSRASQQLKAAVASTPASPVQFIDVAERAGLNVANVWGGTEHKRIIIETKGSGIAFFDYDNDGWLDIYLTNGSRLDAKWPAGSAPTTHLFKNNRDGTFTDVTEKSGIGRSGWQTGVCVGDYDNDGWDDIFCTFWGHNILFHNNGNGTFTDVTKKAGLAQEKGRWGTGCSFVDYDRDGHLDLFVCNFVRLDPDNPPSIDNASFCQWKGVPTMCGPRGLPGDTNILYHNNGDGTFTDVSEKAGILKPGPRYSITSVCCDFDNDGWPDIYVAVDSMPSILYQNNHDGTFTDVAVISGCAYNADGHEQAGMGLGVADYDCDGWFDIFKTNFADDTSDLYHNNGDGTFTDLSFNSGLGINNTYVAWGCGFIDYDNDGWSDIVQINGHVYPEIDKYNFGETFKNPRLVYKNLGNGSFKDVSASMGPGITARYSSRGAAFGDYDNDGGMDILILNMNELPSLLHNIGGNKQNWIKLKLVGTKCNRTAIGARARVIVGKHAQMAEVQSGASVMSQNDLRLHFGLGSAKTIDVIEVKWPTTQKIERFEKVKVNQILTIREGDGIISARPPAS